MPHEAQPRYLVPLVAVLTTRATQSPIAAHQSPVVEAVITQERCQYFVSQHTAKSLLLLKLVADKIEDLNPFWQASIQTTCATHGTVRYIAPCHPANNS